jgi:hypothetical protein
VRDGWGNHQCIFSTIFSNLWVILVGNFVFRRKRIFGGRKRILRPPRIVPVAILLIHYHMLN